MSEDREHQPAGGANGGKQIVSFEVNEQQMDFLRRVSEAEKIAFDPVALTRRSLMEFDAELRRLDNEGRSR